MRSGKLRLNNKLVSSGGLEVAAGAALVFEGGSCEFLAGATLNGAAGASLEYAGGSFSFAPGVAVSGTTGNRVTGSVSFGGTVDLPNFELAGGTLLGAFTNLGTLNWTSGTLAGQMTVAAGGVLTISGEVTHPFNSDSRAMLVNAGTVNWTGGDLAAQGSCLSGSHPVVVSNLVGGVWNLRGAGGMYRDVCSRWEIDNAGVLVKTGPGASLLDSQVNFHNRGLIDVRSGSMAFPQSVSFSGGTVEIAISDRSDYGRLSVAGLATLSGNLRLVFSNDSALPRGTELLPITYGTRTGQFSEIVVQNLPPGLEMRSTYRPDALVVTLVGQNLQPTLAIRTSAEGGFRLGIQTEPGFRYTLEAKDSLSEPSWRELPSIVGDGTERELADPATSAASRFYRVRLDPL